MSDGNSWKQISLPISVVDHCVNDGVHLLGELGGVRGEFLRRGTSTPLLGLAAAIVSARVLVLASLAFTLLQPDLLLHLLQVSILNGLELKKRARAQTRLDKYINK